MDSSETEWGSRYFQVGNENQSIRSHGLYVAVEPETARGGAALVQALTGVDRVHLCRNLTCCEEGGQHFQEYGVVKRLDPERFQVAQASEGARQTGKWIWGWMNESQSTVRKLAGRVREYASESETEDTVKPCQAFLIGWETSEGGERLAKEPCRSVGEAFSNLLSEDRPSAVDQFCLCHAHTAQYLCKRFVNKCSVGECMHVGFINSEGIRKCSLHQRPRTTAKAPEEPPRRPSRSRSRSRARSVSVEPPEEADVEDECSPGEEEGGHPEDILRRAKDSSTPPPRSSRSSKRLRSPGNTPKSSIQRNLAKVGLLDSPDVNSEVTLLQDFCEKLAETKQLGWSEERVRKHLEEDQMRTRENVLRSLISEAEVEQAKGQRGLTKFLVKWREALREIEERGRRPDSDWSVVEESRPTTPSVATSPPQVPPFPSPPPGLKSPQQVETKGVGIRIEAPSVYRADRRAAGQEERGDSSGGQMAQIAKAIQHQTAELASLVKHQADTSTHPPGTVKGLGRQAEEMVFLLRACGQYQVGLGADEYGQALANTLLAAQVGASTRLRAAAFRQKMTPRLAVGIAGAYWGTHEKHCLGASDFIAFTDAELDAFSSEARGGKSTSEQRPANPQRLDEWLTRVKRQVDTWCLCYGEEWRAVKLNAMDKLSTWHLASPHRCPLTVIIDLWEELHWRLYEEVRELLRLLKREAGRETMTLQEIKFHALLPGPDGRAWLRMPSTFDIEEPTGWFQTEVIPRIDRKQERLLWNLTWQGNRKGPMQKEGAGGVHASGGDGAVESDRLSVKNLWGPKLTAEETARAKDRAPTDKGGVLLCWGHLTRVGCDTPLCQRSHEGLRGTFESLDECVRMQLLRRGGLKRMKPETKESVAAKIKDLRAQVARDKSSKIADSKRKGEKAGADEETQRSPEQTKAGGTTGEKVVRFWDVPEEFQVDYTKGEDLQQLVKGPDTKWLEDVHPVSATHGGRGGESAPEEAINLVKKAQQMAKQSVLRALENSSDDLYAWAATRVARTPEVDLESLMSEMATYGVGELAREATEILARGDTHRAGEKCRLQVHETHWAEGQPGQGSLTLDGVMWRLWDYGEDLQMTEELASMLQVAEAGEQRSTAYVGGSANRARALRLEQTQAATAAREAMGPAEEMVSPVEHELRVYVHDLVHSAHEKDFRSLSVFPLADLEDALVVVLRADYRAGLVVETIQGRLWQKGGWVIPLLIWKGHMTLLQPPENFDCGQFLEQEEHVATPALGFEFFWHTRHDQARTAPGKVLCRLCKSSRKAGEVDWMVRTQSCLSQVATVAGGRHQPAEIHRVVRPLSKGLVFQELFAGTAGLTAEWRRSMPALEPVELYTEPHLKRGPRPDHDLLRPEVEARVVENMEGAQGANVYWIASPCTSYCDWQLQNGGTRTWSQPEGTGQGPLAATEEQGTQLSRVGARLFLKALETGNFPVVESSAPSGRYPKQWDLPEWQAILEREDVQHVDLPMCAFRLGPPDEPNSFYVHRTRVAFGRHLPLAQALHRSCPGQSATHKHVALKGCRQGQSVTRCTEAGAYSRDFIAVVVAVLQATLVPGGGPVLQTTTSDRAAGGNGSSEDNPLEEEGVSGEGRSEDENIGPGDEGRPASGGDSWAAAPPEGSRDASLEEPGDGSQRGGGGDPQPALPVTPDVWPEDNSLSSGEEDTSDDEQSATRSIGPGDEGRPAGGGDLRAAAPPQGSRAADLEEPGDGSHCGGGGDPHPALPESPDAGPTPELGRSRNQVGEAEFDRLWRESGAPGDTNRDGSGSESVRPSQEAEETLSDRFYNEVMAVDLGDAELPAGDTAGGVRPDEETWSEEAFEPAGPGSGDSSGWDEDPPGTMPQDEWVRSEGGRLVLRHHRVKRRRLFVPDEAEVPGSLGRLGHRRTTYLTTQNGSSAVITDDWRMEGSTNPGYGWWTGVTRFTLLEREDHDEGADGAGGPGGGPGGSGSEDREDRDPHEEASVEPAYVAPNQEAKQAAQNYVDFLNQGFECDSHHWAAVIKLGNQLLRASGSVEAAAQSLWEVREETGLANLAGVDREDLDEKLHPDLLGYLRDVRKFGMAARYEGERTRVTSKLHLDAKRNLDQVYKQISKDVKKHRVLVVQSDHLSHTMCSPFETVQKLLPDRTVSTDKRLVHDQRVINMGTTKFLHPPAVQPTHSQIARRILWAKARNPNVPVLMAKKDIAGAFRLLWVAPEDVELFGGDVPWKADGFPGETAWADEEFPGVTVIYLVSSFGFSGSPGEWGVWGRATEEFHRAHRPENTRRDLGTGFDSKVLVDDCILVEPQIGLRPWVSAEVFEAGVTQMLGEAAINKDKDVIEGEFRTVQTVWGVVMDTQTETAMLPERRIQKGASLVADANFDFGMKTLCLRDLQRFRGILTGWASILKGLETELKAADVFLGGLDGDARIRPKIRGEGSRPWEEAKAWEDLWDLFEVCRWLSARSETWESTFCTSLKQMLPPLERLGLPGEWARSLFVSSDATPTMVGAIDWGTKKVCRLEVAKLRPWVRLALTDEEQAEIDGQLAIHLGEMLSFVAFACAVGDAWTGAVVVYGGDNIVVKNWLQTRRSSTRGGRILIRVVNMLEMRTKCTILAGWWRTYHNVDADYITRCTDEQYTQFKLDRGLEEVDIEQAVRQALEDSEMFGPCFLSWHEEQDRITLMQLKERRMLRQLQRELVVPWASFEVEEWCQSDRRVRDFEQLAHGLGASPFLDEKKPRLLCASIGSDPLGHQMKKVLERALKGKAWVTLIEGPRQAAWELGEAKCQREGWHFALEEFITTEMGELMARRRRLLVIQHGGLQVEWRMALIRTEVPPSGISVLKGASWSDERSWVTPHKLEIHGPVPRDPMLPRPVGHVWIGPDSEREMVYNIAGPIRWPLMKPGTQEMEEVVVYDRRGPPNALRKLKPEELWKLQGRSVEEWRASSLKDLDPGTRIVEGTRATGGATAANLLAVAGYVMLTMANQETKAGMCRDEEGAIALAQLLLWLRKWRRGDLPRNEARRAGGGSNSHIFRWVEAWWCQYLGEDGDSDEEDSRYAGGRKQKTAEQIAASVAVKLEDMNPRPFDGVVSTRIEEWVEDHLGGDKAVSTSRAYASAWAKWEGWARRQEWISPFLHRGGDEVENENRVLSFLGYLGWLGASAATLRLAVFAIKDAHKRAGSGDPTANMHRVWMLMNAMDRKAVKKPRRLGVTPQMLVWLGNHLVDPFGNDTHRPAYADAVMAMAAMTVAWFYMLRAKEYCDSNGVDEEMVARGVDFKFTRDGQQARGGEANEITFQFRKTKTDQLAFGESKTLKATGKEHLCPVAAMERMRATWPTRFGGDHGDARKPLFRWSSGIALKRLEVQSLLQQAARGVGLPPSRFMSHSLRIGGATALYQSTGEIELVKRMGRWSSSAVQRYLHDGGDTIPKVSQKMASLPSTIHYT
eukprot:s604_g19.t1